jgi:hypothetical protein
MPFSELKRLCVVSAVGVSAMLAAYDAWLFFLSRRPDAGLFSLHRIILTLLVATWVVADTRQSKRAQGSFDHGWFILIAFPIYVAYYLISTRRWRRGLLMLGGVTLLFVLP